MRNVFLLVVLVCLSNMVAAEQLPDHAILDGSTPQSGPGKTLSLNEMGSLYLQSPTLIDEDSAQQSATSATDSQTYLSPEKYRQRERQARNGLQRPVRPKPKPQTASGALLSLTPLLHALNKQH